jgi:Methyltransferase domain
MGRHGPKTRPIPVGARHSRRESRAARAFLLVVVRSKMIIFAPTLGRIGTPDRWGALTMTDKGIEALHRLYSDKYSINGLIPNNMDGWFGTENEQILSRLITNDTKIIVEMGTWLGQSALWMARKAPQAYIVCIDTWLGSVEHHTSYPEKRKDLPGLYSKFLFHAFPYRNQCIPLRVDTLTGLYILREYDIKPDLFYVDASHEYQAVYTDVETIWNFWPEADVVGDDWNWASVSSAVRDVAGMKKVDLAENGRCWWVKR